MTKSQLACFAGCAAAFFFSIWRFSSSARGERLLARAFNRNASRPPLWSTLLIALVETRKRTFLPSASEMKVTLHRFGRNRGRIGGWFWIVKVLGSEKPVSQGFPLLRQRFPQLMDHIKGVFPRELNAVPTCAGILVRNHAK